MKKRLKAIAHSSKDALSGGFIAGLIASIILLALLVGYRIITRQWGAGIVSLPGYEHAVAICGQEGPDGRHVTDQAILIQEEGIFYTINTGHEKDPEIQQVKLLAQRTCGELK